MNPPKQDEAITSLHRELCQGSAFAQAIRTGNLPPENWAGYLRALIAAAALVDRDSLGRLHQEFFSYRYRLLPDNAEAVRQTLDFVSRMRLKLKEQPELSDGYSGALQAILQDPRMGVSSAPADRTLLPEDGVQDDTTVKSENEAALETARETYRFFITLVETLSAQETAEKTYSSFTLNQAGGNYPVCRTQEELLAVLRTSDRALAYNPYYLYRYGMGGWFFSDSDGGWLASLPKLGIDAMEGQVRWLAGVLSCRGMHTVLLSRHLRILNSELSRSLPEQTDQWHLLSETAERLSPASDSDRARLHERLPDLRRSCELGDDYTAREAAEIITGALLDEKRGYEGSHKSVMSWYTSSSRFPQQWIQACSDLSRKIQQLLGIKGTGDV